MIEGRECYAFKTDNMISTGENGIEINLAAKQKGQYYELLYTAKDGTEVSQIISGEDLKKKIKENKLFIYNLQISKNGSLVYRNPHDSPRGKVLGEKSMSYLCSYFNQFKTHNSGFGYKIENRRTKSFYSGTTLCDFLITISYKGKIRQINLYYQGAGYNWVSDEKSLEIDNEPYLSNIIGKLNLYMLSEFGLSEQFC